MYVACPSCKSLYEIELIHLRAAGGQLRCGSCQATFNATAAVFESPQQAIEYAQQHPVQEGVEREIDDLVNRALGEVPGAQPAGEAAAESVTETGAAVGVGEAPDHGEPVAPWADEEIEQTEPTAESAPSSPAGVVESPEERAAGTGVGEVLAVPPRVPRLAGTDSDFYACPVAGEFRSPQPQEGGEALELSAALLYADEIHDQGSAIPWAAIAVSVLLAVLLLGQIAWAERYRLVQYPQLRAALEFFCQPLPCDLPLRHDTASLEMVERDVRDHPHVRGALLINASFINRADFPQAYPLFEVSFSDVSGTPVAVRRFQPAEYLLGRQDIPKGMDPGERAQLMLEILDPGDRAVSFQFDFM